MFVSIVCVVIAVFFKHIALQDFSMLGNDKCGSVNLKKVILPLNKVHISEALDFSKTVLIPVCIQQRQRKSNFPIK